MKNFLERFRGIINESIDSREKKVVAGVLIKCIETNNVFLLLRNDKTPVWALVSGTIEPGESVLTGLKREIYEELFVNPSTIDFKFIGVEKINEKNIEFHYYEGFVDKEFSPILDEENLDGKWFSEGKLPGPLYKALPEKINKIFKNGDSLDAADNTIDESESTKKIKYVDEHINSYGGQHDYELGLYLDGEIVGMTQYVLYDGEITVSDILVRPEFRRQGYGSRMMKYIKEKHSDYTYKPSMKTDLGSKFKHKDIVDEVRSVIKSVIFESDILSERLMDVNDDVDYIYDRYFKNDLDEVHSTGIVTRNMFKAFELSTADLKSPLSIKAHKTNPCHIFINKKLSDSNNFYSPNNKMIVIGINDSAVYFVLSHSGNLSKASKELRLIGEETQSKNIIREFSVDRIKGSIHHELVHWIDDTLHNSHILKRILVADENGSGLARSGTYIGADKMEIQSQIHNIVQSKRVNGDVWDFMSFEDLLSVVPTLNIVYGKLKDSEKKGWIRNLRTRMHREGLLGNNMVN